ncbi:AAA family ATPase [Fibrobacter sp.]|uniref:AAA family ATPase n=1 Tax=Fibrobacter sp. TaxID=35828 RepID=UPI00388EFCA3
MLLSFTVGNFRSFKENKTFSMKAASIQEHKDFVRESEGSKLLPVAAVYGANSSGKSNLLSALRMMKDVLLSSVKTNPTEKLKTDTFKLDEEHPQKPTLFDIVFSTNGTTYRYGFEYTETSITGEWLYTVNNDREKNLFIRNSEGIGVSKDFPEGKDKEEATAENRLFLSLVAQLNGKTSLAVMKWFEDLRVMSGAYDSDFQKYSYDYLFADDPKSQLAQTFINKMDLGFTSIRKANTEDDKKGPLGSESKPKTGHKVLRKDGSFTEAFFSNDEMESEGTKKIINMSGPIADTLLNGGIIVIDELDAKLHPLLTKKIIDTFNSPETNPYNAQLIFATHDTNLLSNKIFRRDQIWFAEKNREDESTDIYPLSEIKEQNGDKIRNDRVYEKDYINGKYGAIPYLRG